MTDRASAQITIKPVVIEKQGPDEQWWSIVIVHRGVKVYSATCWSQEDAEVKRACWLAGGDPDNMTLKVRELLAGMAIPAH